MSTATETPTVTDEQIDEALRLIASAEFAAVSAVQRWMRISFRDASAILDALEQRGIVGPADGSKARTVHVRRCEQCGRIGKRGFHTHIDDKHDIRIRVCANRTACRKRWPKPADDEAAG
ncbi:DNA translocase FtsK [Streptomyces tendae]|uniref:DNA translocase FtsK n=1 Tax=Streptomyces tendae TaxID=1932 RepID=UPI0034080823